MSSFPAPSLKSFDVNIHQPDLTVSGFIRHQCPYEVPVVVVDLMTTFYSLWIKTTIRSEDLESLKAFVRASGAGHFFRQTLIPFQTLKVDGQEFPIWLQMVLPSAWSNHRINNRAPDIQLYLLAAIPSSVDSIAGRFAAFELNQESFESKWIRTKRSGSAHSNRVNRLSDLLLQLPSYDRLEFQQRTELSIWSFCDIHQIKYLERENETNQKDFNITPSLNRYGRFQWIIEGEDLRALQKGFGNSEPINTVDPYGWHWCCSWSSKMPPVGLERQLVLNGKANCWPMNVDDGNVKVMVRFKRKGRKTCVRNKNCSHGFGLEMKALKGLDRIEFDIEYELMTLQSNGEDIDEDIWEQYGVI